ncbi:MAG: ATP-binding cassette domain-containing protein [Lentilactobacillus diolivorans]
MINLKNICKSYRPGKNVPLVLKDINLDLNDTGLVYLVGESGSGKSTLLNIIGGMDTTDSGKYELFGNDVTHLSEKEWTSIRQKKFGIVFQNYNLISHLSVKENVALGIKLSPSKDKADKVKETLNLVGMWDKRDHLPNQLSGGQQQRVAIARALIKNPEIILADEPTGALDSENANQIMQLLKQISLSGKLVIVVTHSQDYMDLADRVIRLADGKINDEKLVPVSDNSAHGTSKTVFSKANHLSRNGILKMAFKNVQSKKRRSLLTALGSAIGIMGVLLVIFFNTGINNYISSQFKMFRTNKVLMVNRSNYGLISKSKREAIFSMNGVKKGYSDYTFQTSVNQNGRSASLSMATYAPSQAKKMYTLADLKVGKYADKRNEVVIPAKTARKLFGSTNNALGKSIKLTAQLLSSGGLMPTETAKVNVVGVTKNKIMNQLNTAYASHQLAQSLVNHSTVTKNDSNELLIETTSLQANKKLEAKLKHSGYYVVTPKQDMASGKQYINAIFIFLGIVAGISLIVAAILIAIVVYVNVLERRKEIGTLKALGVLPGDIRKMFMTEGAILGILGGSIGAVGSLVFGAAANLVLSHLFRIDEQLIQFAPKAILIAIIACMILGMVTSIIPAQKAARKSIVSALNNG